MVATIVPFGSELYFVTLLSLGKYNNLLLLVSASIGNVLGSVFNWICGYYINYFIKKSWFPIKQDKMTTIKANPNATNSELDAKIIIKHNNMNDQDYLNLIQLIKDNHHTQNDTYWHNVLDKLYTKLNDSLSNKRNRL